MQVLNATSTNSSFVHLSELMAQFKMLRKNFSCEKSTFSIKPQVVLDQDNLATLSS